VIVSGRQLLAICQVKSDVLFIKTTFKTIWNVVVKNHAQSQFLPDEVYLPSVAGLPLEQSTFPCLGLEYYFKQDELQCNA